MKRARRPAPGKHRPLPVLARGDSYYARYVRGDVAYPRKQRQDVRG
jgi:hypothetical protein